MRLVYGATISSTSPRPRPLSARNRSRVLIFAAADSGSRLKPYQPSPYSATRRRAGSLSPPKMTGTRAPWSGFGKHPASAKRSSSPVWLATPGLQSLRMTSMYSRVRRARRSKGMPSARNSSADQPMPTPRAKRPLARRSRLATVLARMRDCAPGPGKCPSRGGCGWSPPRRRSARRRDRASRRPRPAGRPRSASTDRPSRSGRRARRAPRPRAWPRRRAPRSRRRRG